MQKDTASQRPPPEVPSNHSRSPCRGPACRLMAALHYLMETKKTSGRTRSYLRPLRTATLPHITLC